MSAMILGGSWNIIGWAIIAVVAAFAMFILYWIAAAGFTAVGRSVRLGWQRFWCRHGFHKKGAFVWSLEKVQFEDMPTGDKVHREYDVETQRCTRCVTLLAQEKTLAKEDRFTRHWMQHSMPIGADWAQRH